MMDRLCIWMADMLGTNTAIAVFVLIAFVPLAYHLPQTVLEWQTWLSQVCIQLIALAVIQKGQKVTEGRVLGLLQETHDTVMKEMAILKKSATGEDANG